MIKRSERNTKFRIHFKEVFVVFDLFSKNLRVSILKDKNFFFSLIQTNRHMARVY